MTHPPRPPIPMRPLDAAAASGRSGLPAWLAGVTGSAAPVVREHLVEVAAGAPPSRAVAEVAAAVDRGRDLAGAAAGEGVTVLVARGGPAPGHLVAWLAGEAPPGPPEDVPRGPLGALRRWGAGSTWLLCGVALGAGEHGLGLLCDGLDALAAAGVAVGIEPDLRPRVLAAGAADGPAHAALARRLGVAVAVPAGGAGAALAALRSAAG